MYQIRGRTVTFDRTFFPKTISDWNMLSRDLKNAPSAEAFSNRLNSKDRVPTWYAFGDRTNSILHARMRMLCSPLADHLYSQIHVIDSPQCQCGFARENNKHYLLQCPLYDVERMEMVTKLTEINFQPTVNNLLFGNNDYSESKNETAFSIIHKFIKSTRRFD